MTRSSYFSTLSKPPCRQNSCQPVAGLWSGLNDDASRARSDAVVRNHPSTGTRIDQIATLDELVKRTTAQPRFTSRLVALFGASALLLAAVGIYGTQWYLVGIRT